MAFITKDNYRLIFSHQQEVAFFEDAVELCKAAFKIGLTASIHPIRIDRLPLTAGKEFVVDFYKYEKIKEGENE